MKPSMRTTKNGQSVRSQRELNNVMEQDGGNFSFVDKKALAQNSFSPPPGIGGTTSGPNLLGHGQRAVTQFLSVVAEQRRMPNHEAYREPEYYSNAQLLQRYSPGVNSAAQLGAHTNLPQGFFTNSGSQAHLSHQRLASAYGPLHNEKITQSATELNRGSKPAPGGSSSKKAQAQTGMPLSGILDAHIM